MREVTGENLTCKFYLFNIKIALPSDAFFQWFLNHWGSRIPDVKTTNRLVSTPLHSSEPPPCPSDQGSCNDDGSHNFKQLHLDTLSESPIEDQTTGSGRETQNRIIAGLQKAWIHFQVYSDWRFHWVKTLASLSFPFLYLPQRLLTGFC